VTEAIIAADDNTNILMISAPPEQLELIQGMLERLDVLPPQVHIQAIIADVSLSRNTALGFQWSELKTLGPYGGDNVTLDFSTFFGISTEEDNFGLFGEIAGDQLAGVLQALTTDSNARILAAPSIFTANNLEAEINISQQLPFPTGTFQSTVAAETISTSLEYQSIGIVLRVTPRVTQGGTVQLDIQLEANEPGASVPIAGEEFPSYNQRLAQATLSVKNGHTIVLGGLMREKIERTAQKVPLLGDIPFLGSLFRSRSTERTKSELLLFLTPRIVRSPAEAAAVTESEKSRLWSVPQILRRPADVPAPGVDEWWMPGYEDVGPTDLDEWESYEEDMLEPLEEEQTLPPDEELPTTPDAEQPPSVDEEEAGPCEPGEELPAQPDPGAGAEAGETRPEAEAPALDLRPEPA
jgi:general secretion pathway protein D